MSLLNPHPAKGPNTVTTAQARSRFISISDYHQLAEGLSTDPTPASPDSGVGDSKPPTPESLTEVSETPLESLRLPPVSRSVFDILNETARDIDASTDSGCRVDPTPQEISEFHEKFGYQWNGERPQAMLGALYETDEVVDLTSLCYLPSAPDPSWDV